ncbi:MAG: D-glycero-beta-D-manno-heptose 1,7-bisphosphate 7-phosphatase, partial [Nanoarchaeota archaeon]|nr:D-glycero-beta-D-manno-heptose 1,7-bisphosphate 7-phosphatase [Nanoarchaeota archaeon]
MRKKHRAVFLDRDGTINVYKSYMWKIEDFEWIPGAKEGLQMLSKTDHKIVIVSNQSGVGRGYYTREDVDRLHNWMKKECEGFGVEIHAIYYCPHHPDDGCSCRKPNPGMIHKAAEELGLNLKKSWLIGDNVTDIVAGRAAGVKTIKIKNEKLEEKESPGVRPHRHVEDLKEGIEHLVRYSRRTLILKALLFVVAVGMPVLLWQRGVITKEGIFSFLESYPNFAPLLFIIITALGIALILPIAIIMGLGAGFFWGTWIGGLYAFFGLTLGTALVFFVSRYLAK